MGAGALVAASDVASVGSTSGGILKRHKHSLSSGSNKIIKLVYCAKGSIIMQLPN